MGNGFAEIEQSGSGASGHIELQKDAPHDGLREQLHSFTLQDVREAGGNQVTDSLRIVPDKPVAPEKNAEQLAAEWKEAFTKYQQSGSRDQHAFDAFKEDLGQAFAASTPAAFHSLVEGINSKLPDGQGLIFTKKENGGYDDFQHYNVHLLLQPEGGTAGINGGKTYHTQDNGDCTELSEPLHLSRLPAWYKELLREPKEIEYSPYKPEHKFINPELIKIIDPDEIKPSYRYHIDPNRTHLLVPELWKSPSEKRIKIMD